MSDIPTKPKVSRRLAAILAADIAGYSALMGADEATTVRDLKAHQAVVLPMIAEHGGRIIDTAGDGILAEFGSVVHAVECAVAIQRTMAERNTTVEASRRMQYRIGINLGDVIHDGVRIYGDGINIAARLESLAEPGGICISGKVNDEIAGKVRVVCEDLGFQSLKNINQPVRGYKIGVSGTPSVAADAMKSAQKPAFTVPDKPSIAVLPFTNLSGDQKEDYFSDGITEDIITELSRFSELFVIARNSSFQYKGKSPDIRQVGRDLGVRYVLEGSIRRGGDRVRITAQLIDATTGAHRWAERYDRELKDVFAVQDELARTIAVILAAHLNKAETERALLKAPTTWKAYDYYMRAAGTFASFWSSMLIEELYETRRLLEAAIELDPNYARPYTTLSFTYIAAAQNRVDDDFMSSCRVSPSPSARTQGDPDRSKLARCSRRARCRLDMDKWSKRCQRGSLREGIFSQPELQRLAICLGTCLRRRADEIDPVRGGEYAARPLLSAFGSWLPGVCSLLPQAILERVAAVERKHFSRPKPAWPAPLARGHVCADGPTRRSSDPCRRSIANPS